MDYSIGLDFAKLVKDYVKKHFPDYYKLCINNSKKYDIKIDSIYNLIIIRYNNSIGYFEIDKDLINFIEFNNPASLEDSSDFHTFHSSFTTLYKSLTYTHKSSSIIQFAHAHHVLRLAVIEAFQALYMDTRFRYLRIKILNDQFFRLKFKNQTITLPLDDWLSYISIAYEALFQGISNKPL